MRHSHGLLCSLQLPCAMILYSKQGCIVCSSSLPPRKLSRSSGCAQEGSRITITPLTRPPSRPHPSLPEALSQAATAGQGKQKGDSPCCTRCPFSLSVHPGLITRAFLPDALGTTHPVPSRGSCAHMSCPALSLSLSSALVLLFVKSWCCIVCSKPLGLREHFTGWLKSACVCVPLKCSRAG